MGCYMTRNERKVFRELVFRVVLAEDYYRRRKMLLGPMSDASFKHSLEAAAHLVEEAHGLHPPAPAAPSPETQPS